MDVLIGAGMLVTAMIGLFGWSHKALRNELDRLRSELFTEREVRQLISDKMAIEQTKSHSLKEKIENLRQDYKDLSKKLDKLMDLCVSIKNGN